MSQQPDERTRHPAEPTEETSAGGLVVDPRHDVPRAALIGRRRRRGVVFWALPKGHVEVGETLEQTAVREVEEETGIRGRVLRSIGVVDYSFSVSASHPSQLHVPRPIGAGPAEGRRRIHKTVHHFLLLAEDGELSADDVEVDEVAWVPLSEVSARLGHVNERALVEGDPRLATDAAAAVR